MNPWMNCLVASDAAVHLAHGGALDHQVEGPPHLADRVHAVKDAAGAETVLGRLVARTRFAERVSSRYPHIVVDDLAVVALRPQTSTPRTMRTPGVFVGHDDLRHAAVVAATRLRCGT